MTPLPPPDTERHREVLRIREDSDVFATRRRVRELAAGEGLSERAREALVVAVTEVVRNVLVHAGHGELIVRVVEGAQGRELVVTAEDDGPGIADIARAMEDGYSTGAGLGLGLSSARRLVDRFEMDSTPGVGTRVTLRMTATAPGRRAPT